MPVCLVVGLDASIDFFEFAKVFCLSFANATGFASFPVNFGNLSLSSINKNLIGRDDKDAAEKLVSYGVDYITSNILE